MVMLSRQLVADRDAPEVDETRHAVFVEGGQPRDVTVVGRGWRAGDGYIECAGPGNYLYAGKVLGEGDVHIKARLALRNLAKSAASFDIETSHFGFDGGGGQGMFVSGPMFGKLRFLGPIAGHAAAGKPFDLEVIRRNGQLSFLIDGNEVSNWRDRRKEFGSFCLRPWRATMRVYHFSASGQLRKQEVGTMSKLKHERNCLLPPGQGNARNSEGDFVQLKDGRVLFVYAHYFEKGRDVSPAALMGRYSSDGGRTWTKEDSVIAPREGNHSQRSVSLLRLVDGRIALFYLNCTSWPDDERPLVRFSVDEAKTWSDPKPIIPDEDAGYYVTNNDRVVQLKSGRILLPTALHHDPPSRKFTGYGRVMAYISDDNGQTWRRSKSVRTGEHPSGKRILLQEPGAIELRDGRVMMFCRTDLGCQLVSYSDDEGETWSEFKPSNMISPRSPATIERIPKTGDLLLVWNNHDRVPPQYRGKRSPLNAAISRDEGKTWAKIKTLEDDPGGHYCYTAMEFVGDYVLLAYCAGQRAAGGLNVIQITRFSVDALYE